MVKIIVWCYVLLSYLLALIIYSLTLNLPEELKEMHSFIEELEKEDNKNIYIEEKGEEAYYDLLARLKKLEQNTENALEEIYSMGITTFNQGYIIMFVFAPFVFIPLVIYALLSNLCITNKK